jgi:hypothetical protein
MQQPDGFRDRIMTRPHFILRIRATRQKHCRRITTRVTVQTPLVVRIGAKKKRHADTTCRQAKGARTDMGHEGPNKEGEGEVNTAVAVEARVHAPEESGATQGT